MQTAAGRASLLQALRDHVFTDPDLLQTIKAHVGCETITNWCLTNKHWCDKVHGNHELRIEIARCVMIRINDKMSLLRDMLDDDIAANDGRWNEPTSPLFLELGGKYFAVEINLANNRRAADFLDEHPIVKESTQNIGKLLALLFNVRVVGEAMDTDTHDPGYSNLFVRFDQEIPRDVRLKLPFSSIVSGHDNQINLYPVEDLELDTFSFDELLNWQHLRRGQRNRRPTEHKAS